MRLGVHVVTFTPADGAVVIGPTLAEIGRVAEDAGVVNLSLMDHYLQLGGWLGPPEDPMLEGYTSLGFLAGLTRNAELQLLVTGVTYRHPGLLAKTVSTLDILSGGRAMLGLGAAWYEREHQAYGVPYPPVAERFERLEETLQIVLQMWSDNDGPYQGQHYQLAETINSPQPIRRPHPPIMIGGDGEKKTLRLVAQYADACNLFAGRDSLDKVAHKLGVLREHCERLGTDYDRLRRSILWNGPLDPTTAAGGQAFVEEMHRYAEIGVDEVRVMPIGPDPVGFVRGLGDHVVPALADV